MTTRELHDQVSPMTLANQVQTPICSLNGKYIPFAEACLPVYDLAIMQGASVTERLRTFAHVPFGVQAHIDRLKRSLAFVNWEEVSDLDELAKVIETVVSANVKFIETSSDLSIVLFVTGGQNVNDSNDLIQNSSPAVCVYTAPLPMHRWQSWYVQGVDLIVPDRRQISVQSLDPRIKMRSRMHWMLADQTVHASNPSAQALLLDQDGFLTETSSGNLIVVQNGNLRLPHLEKVLNGITQRHVLELCQDANLRFEFVDLTLQDLLSADEAFLTSSTYCLAPVRSVNGETIGSNRPGPVTSQLTQLFSELVQLDFVSQAAKAANKI